MADNSYRRSMLRRRKERHATKILLLEAGAACYQAQVGANGVDIEQLKVLKNYVGRLYWNL